MYNFAVIDPRSATTIPATTLGIEVTVPAFAALCDLGNVDDQHVVGASGRAACDLARTWQLPPDGATLATIRPDLDSVGAMAVFALRSAEGVRLTREVEERVLRIAEVDRFRPGGTWTPCPLPTEQQPFPRLVDEDEHGNPAYDRARAVSVDAHPSLAWLGAICSPLRSQGDVEHPLPLRVAVVAAWLLGGDDPAMQEVATACLAAGYARLGEVTHAVGEICDAMRSARAHVLDRRRAAARSLVTGETTIVVSLPGWPLVDARTHAPLEAQPGAIAVVRSSFAGATGLGYCVAPVVAALHPSGKWTIAAYTDGHADLACLVTRLNELEAAAGGSPTWGGPRNMCCSPQSHGTVLAEDVILRELHNVRVIGAERILAAAELADSVDMTATSAGYYPGPFCPDEGPSLAMHAKAGRLDEARAILVRCRTGVRARITAGHTTYEGCDAGWLLAICDRLETLLAEVTS